VPAHANLVSSSTLPSPIMPLSCADASLTYSRRSAGGHFEDYLIGLPELPVRLPRPDGRKADAVARALIDQMGPSGAAAAVLDMGPTSPALPRNRRNPTRFTQVASDPRQRLTQRALHLPNRITTAPHHPQQILLLDAEPDRTDLSSVSAIRISRSLRAGVVSTAARRSASVCAVTSSW
jgi:hypothetical protein